MLHMALAQLFVSRMVRIRSPTSIEGRLHLLDSAFNGPERSAGGPGSKRENRKAGCRRYLARRSTLPMLRRA